MSTSNLLAHGFEHYPLKLGERLTRREQAEHLDAIIDSLKPILPKAIKHTLFGTYDTGHGDSFGQNRRRLDHWNPEIVPGTSGYSGSTKLTRYWVPGSFLETRFTKHLDGKDVAFKKYSKPLYGLTKSCEWLTADCEFEDIDDGLMFDSGHLCLNRILLYRPESTEHLLEWAKMNVHEVVECLLLPCLRSEEGRLHRRTKELSAAVEHTHRCSSVLEGFY